VALHTRTQERAKHPPAARLVEARGHYPVWSVKSIAWLSVITVSVTGTIIAVSGKRSILVELEWTLGVVAAALFAMLAIGLYRGARLKEKDAPSAELQKVDLSDWTPDTGLPDLDCPLDAVDGELGCLGVIAGVLLAIVAFVVLTIFLWVFLQFAVIVLFIVMTAIYWVLHLALRQVFAHSQDCRGNLPRSLGFATLYTVLYTGWLFALLFLTSAMRT
jgi:hypothetical protein